MSMHNEKNALVHHKCPQPRFPILYTNIMLGWITLAKVEKKRQNTKKKKKKRRIAQMYTVSLFQPSSLGIK
jgi:hypothetical protein